MSPPPPSPIKVFIRDLTSDSPTWFQNLEQEEIRPNPEQLNVLRGVRERLLTEIELLIAPRSTQHVINGAAKKVRISDPREEPMRSLIHGFPGTGKSKVIQWIIRLFTEVMEWTHAVEFKCVAFQNRVAWAMRGHTIHTAAHINPMAQHSYTGHTDIDTLFTENQHLRWVIFDEVFMIPDDLLGTFMKNYQEAAPQGTSSRYFARSDQTYRICGGLNWCMFGDMLQLPPIPACSAIFVPPQGKPKPPTKTAEELLDAFWTGSEESLNFFVELSRQERTKDIWYKQLLDECRVGALTEENYNFLMGLPTAHHGCWLPSPYEAQSLCTKRTCQRLHGTWAEYAKQGVDWSSMQRLARECAVCAAERKRRCRQVASHLEKVSQEPFLRAPYVHQNNQPKYHAMLVRALEHAKRGGDTPEQVLWIQAKDTPLKPQDLGRTQEQIDKKRERFLQLHDQKTRGIPGLLVVYMNAPVRITEKIKLSSEIIALKHTSGKIVGWELHAGDSQETTEFQRVLNYTPKVLYVQFPEVRWRLSGLPQGVLPVQPVQRTWTLNKATGVQLTREGFTLVNDFASTAFMTQGETLEAMIADCGDLWEVVG